MEGGKGRGFLLLLVVRVRTVREKFEGWVCRARRMWGPRLPVAPMRAMVVRGGVVGVDMLLFVFSVVGGVGLGGGWLCLGLLMLWEFLGRGVWC